MSRYDPNSMTRVLNIEKYDFREKSSACSSESEDDESINGIFKTQDGLATAVSETVQTKGEAEKPPRSGLFGIKRLGLSRKDRERDADAAAGSIKSETDSKLRGSLESNCDSTLRGSVESRGDETYMTLGTALTGDHVNALLKAQKAYANVSEEDDSDDDADNKGAVEDYWKPTEPGTVIRDATVLTSIPRDEDEEIPISDRIGDRGKAERRNTSNSMMTAPFDDGNVDLSTHLDDDIEDDLLKYAEAMMVKNSMSDDGDKKKRPSFKSSTSICTDAVSTADTERVKNSGLDEYDSDEDDEEQQLKKNPPFVRRSSMERLRNFLTGGDPTPSSPSETYDLSSSFRVSTKKKEKKAKKTWNRRTSDGTADSMWSWSQAGNIVPSGFNRRSSNDSHRSNNSGNYSNDDDDKSHTSGGTFDNSWLGLGNIAQKNGRGGASWRDARRITLTPFVDYDGDSFHSQRSTPYRMGERTLKQCIGLMFVLAIIVLSGALIGINIASKDDTLGQTLTRDTPYSALTEEEKLAVAESVNEACSSSAIEQPNGRYKCQQICHEHFCCFDDSTDGYNCQDDASKSCSVYAGCLVLIEDLINVDSAVVPEVEYVSASTLASRINDACSNIKTSMGKLECHQACDDHMCCFELDSNKSCRQDEKMECFAYEACAALPIATVLDEPNDNASVDKPSVPLPTWDTSEPINQDLPSWDTAEAHNGNEVQKIDYASDDSVLHEGNAGTIGSETQPPNESQVFIPSAYNDDNEESTQFVPLDGSIESSEGVTEEEVDSVCQNISDSSNKNKCAKMCVEHMCCFESDEEKACLTNTDCSVYGSCVLLGTDFLFDAHLASDDEEITIEDDEYSYDDDMYIVDTEGDDEADAYDSTLYHIGNRTLHDSYQASIEEEKSSNL